MASGATTRAAPSIANWPSPSSVSSKVWWSLASGSTAVRRPTRVPGGACSSTVVADSSMSLGGSFCPSVPPSPSPSLSLLDTFPQATRSARKQASLFMGSSL
jgi:hypothetical protein